MPGSDILSDLEARGLVHDHTDRAEFAAVLDEGPTSVYCGFDPTADSLHVGNLIGLLVLRRFQLAGHRPIALAGGATGMVGDPSFRSDERNLLDTGALAANVAAIKEQLSRFVDFDDASVPAVLVDNAEWTSAIGVLDFLRDVGKHFTVNQMVAKESVRSRMASESGISFTEFSYMLLQANDFIHLSAAFGCRAQVGGSDQWGNITAGIDLIRRRLGVAAHGLTWPLLTRTDGSKFGKSQGANIWLSPARTSPYRFFQYWINTDDRDLERFLLQLTLLEVDEVRGIVRDHQTAPDRRIGQERLAVEITALVHGASAVAAARDASSILFGRGDIAGPPSAEAMATVAAEVPSAPWDPADRHAIDPVELLVVTGLASSKGDARRAIAGNGVAVAGRRLASTEALGPDSIWHDRYVLARRGKSYGVALLGR